MQLLRCSKDIAFARIYLVVARALLCSCQGILSVFLACCNAVARAILGCCCGVGM